MTFEKDGLGIAKCWEVEVRVDGEPVLTIGSGYQSGVNDLDPYADTVRACGEHLLSFIGPDQPQELDYFTAMGIPSPPNIGEGERCVSGSAAQGRRCRPLGT